MTDIIINLITTAGVIIVAFISAVSMQRIKKIETDTVETLEQTANRHATAEYPNLRDELTATRKTVERNTQRMEGFIRDVDEDAKSTRHALDRHIKAEERRAKQLEAEMRELLSEHSIECPLSPRSQKLITK